ncbi:major capsid protein [Microvirus sp.]|nr:major capsid protein [Microvirus sp.]
MSTFKLPTPSPTLPRNGFDLSTRRVFTAPAGALLPVLTQEVNPGEHFSISVQDLVRTQPLNTAAFARCKEYYHFFFVPYKALWSSSDRFFTGVTNGDSTYRSPGDFSQLKDSKGVGVYNTVPDSVPCFDLFRYLYNIGLYDDQKHFVPHITDSEGDDVQVSPTDRIPFVDLDIHVDDSHPSDKAPQHSPDYLPKGSLSSLVAGTSRRPVQKKGLITANNDLRRDVCGYSYAYGAYRLLNHLEYGVCSDGTVYVPRYDERNKKYSYDLSSYLRFPMTDKELGKITKDMLNYRVSALRPLAYQRIYNDFYRNHQWEKSDPTCFNVDYLFKGGLVNDVTLENMFTLRYRYLSKDWLTSALPTVNYSDGIFKLPSYTGMSSVAERDSNSTYFTNLDSGNLLSVSDIKAAFALDKMLEATRRANGLDYSSQIAAHYGFKVPDSRRPSAHFIGGFDNAVGISEVISTASGSTDDKGNNASVPGQLFGKGIGSMTSNKIDYDVKEHGVIMCIYSIAPQVDYNADYMSPFNRKLDRMDYYQPEFQNLGLQPIMQSDLCFTVDSKLNNSILGYTSRYAEYKSSRDLVLGEFQSDNSLSAWTTPRRSIFTFGVNKDGTVDKSYLSLSNFMVNPNVLDSIFSVKYDGSSKTDQFMVNCYFDVKAVRPMSVVGSINL